MTTRFVRVADDRWVVVQERERRADSLFTAIVRWLLASTDR